MYYFGATSVRRMRNVNPILIDCAKSALEISDVDMTIPWRGGYRTAAQQYDIFMEGNTKADGYKKLSYHQSGQAIDVIPYKSGDGRYFGVNEEFLYFAKLMIMIFNEQKNFCAIDEDTFLHWGGFWGDQDLDGNGILDMTDKLGWDCAHWELRDYPQKSIRLIAG